MEIIIASTIAFATTNLDDIFILTLFFSNSKFSSKNVVIGQYLGISTLTAVSFLGSFIGLIVDPRYIGLLGLIPIYIGVKAIVNLRGKNSPPDEDFNVAVQDNLKHRHQVISVASVSIANGGDNISIYIPLFATLSLSNKFTMTVIFLIMTALWCFAARYLSKRPLIRSAVDKYGHIITPFIFILLGMYIIYESETFDLFKGEV